MKSTKIKRFLWLVAVPVLILVAVLSSSASVRADEGQSGIETLDLSAYILQEGGLGVPEYQAEEEEGVSRRPIYLGTGSVRDVIYSSLKNKSTNINVVGYGILREDLGTVYWGVINTNPDLFYVDGTVSFSTDGTYVTAILPNYDPSYTDEHIAVYNNKVAEIISGVDSSWSEIQKALYMHEYLVTHAQYDTTYERYDAYNALVEGNAVCQGYALATVQLLKNVGVDVDLITSLDLNHAWNLIEIDGEYFYTDATWDDPVGVPETYCGHKNFMVDRAGLVATGHDTTDWMSSMKGTNVYNQETSDRYVDWFWAEMETALPMIGTKTGYLSDGQISIYDFANGVTSGYDRVMETWPAWGINGYYPGDYSSMAVADGAFFFTTPKDIYRMNLDGTIAKVYSLSEAEAAQGYIYSLSGNGKTLTYGLGTVPYGSIVYTGTYNIISPVEAFVTRMYQMCLSRNPDDTGLRGWVSELEGGYMDGAAIAQQFVFSKEMITKNLSNSEFVDVLCRAILGRESGEAGKQRWVNQLDNRYMTRNELTKAFVESAEFTKICEDYGIVRGTYATPNTAIEQFVDRLSVTDVEKSITQKEYYNWVNGIATGIIDGADVARELLFRDAIVSKNLSNTEFVEFLYMTLLNRSVGESGKNNLVYQLDNHTITRSELAKVLVDSEEFAGICNRYGVVAGTYDTTLVPLEKFTTRFYTLCLERNPDQPGLYGWVHNLRNQRMNGAQIANQFFFSVEFTQKNVSNEKYVELLYNTLMGRPADEQGKSGWLNQLGNGYMSREDIMKAFIESQEFTLICEAYGIIRGSLE